MRPVNLPGHGGQAGNDIQLCRPSPHEAPGADSRVCNSNKATSINSEDNRGSQEGGIARSTAEREHIDDGIGNSQEDLDQGRADKSDANQACENDQEGSRTGRSTRPADASSGRSRQQSRCPQGAEPSEARGPGAAKGRTKGRATSANTAGTDTDTGIHQDTRLTGCREPQLVAHYPREPGIQAGSAQVDDHHDRAADPARHVVLPF